MEINDLENNLDTSTFKYNDFNPWPFIKFKLIRKSRFNKSQNNFNHNREITKEKLSGRLLRLIYSLIDLIIKPIKKGKVDILYFTKSSEFKKNSDNKLYNEYLDPLVNFVGNEISIKILEINNTQSLIKRDLENSNHILLNSILEWSLIKTKLKNIFGKKKININQSLFNDKIDIINLEKELFLLNEISKNFEIILKKLNPKVVYLVCFYDMYSMAMSLACHRHKIKVIEYQHGFLNDYYSMHQNWKNIPHKGYELVPDIFWMWSKEDKEKIDKWTNKTSKHKAIVGGNMWISHNKKINTYNKFKNQNGKKNILVILQYSPLPEFFINFLKTNKENFNWYFRKHPLHPIPQSLKEFLEIYSYESIEVTSNRNLYETFNFIDVNITLYSSVGFEAQCFHVPSIFMGEIAKYSFKKFLGKNGLFYANNENDLNYYLINLENISKIDSFHILFDEDKIIKHIKSSIK